LTTKIGSNYSALPRLTAKSCPDAEAVSALSISESSHKPLNEPVFWLSCLLPAASMLTISDIKLGSIINHNGQPYSVISAQHVKMGRGGANLKTKLKNLITGGNLEITFSSSDKVEEADLERSKANFLYQENGQYYFMDNESFEQFELDRESLGDQADFLKDGLIVDVLVYEGKPVSVKLPVKVEFKVVESPPGIKGDTAGSASKVVKLESGKEIKAPLFINQGDVIKINTETGEYVERVS